MPHRERPRVPSYLPVHVTLKVRAGVGNLRDRQRSTVIEGALYAARHRYGMRLVHWSIQHNHLHLIVEVGDANALARGMHGLCIRLARRLNAVDERRGPVFVDRYHAELLRSPQQARNAIRYVEKNVFLHARADDCGFPDRLSSDWYRGAPDDLAPQVEPRTWLLRVGWTRARG